MDSHGTSAEGGGDSEGEGAHGRLVGMHTKKPAGAMRSNSHGYDFGVSSGSTSHSNSALSSPNGSTANVFSTNPKRGPPNVLKVKGELVRKRSRDTMKSTTHSAAAPSPKKLDNSHLKSKSGEIEPTSRYFGSSAPTSQSYYNPSGYSTMTGCSGGGGYGTTVSMPAPVQEDLGLDLVPDFYFPSSGFPEDPYGPYNPHLRTTSNDTDLTNHTPQYFNSAFGVGYSLTDGGEDDDGLMHLLDKIDWDEEVTQSTADNSRPLSPVTDTASSVGSHPTNHSSRVQLHNPVVPFALAMTSKGRHEQPQAVSAVPSATTSTESVSSEISRLSAEYPAPSSPTSEAMHASIATGIAMSAKATAQEDDDLQPQHRLTFSSVIDELKLVTKVAKSNLKNGAPSEDCDHISLFDLFQRDGAQSVGRLPPLRALVQHAIARGAVSATTTTTSVAPSSSHVISTTDSAPAGNSLEFDDHEFDFSSFMNDDFHYEPGSNNNGNGFDNQVLQMQFLSAEPALTAAKGSNGPISGAEANHAAAASDAMFGSDSCVLDVTALTSSGTLLTSTMQPSAPGSKNATPSVAQRKRGRPRKYSISVPAAPASTPSAATAKSLLSGPALAHALSTQQYQSHQSQQDPYVVPVNATVLQAYNLAVSQSTGSEFIQSARSFSGDSAYSSYNSYSSLHHSPNGLAGYNDNAYLNGPDIRLGLTRTMSSESDTMMANAFDLKLYDDTSYGVGMLEDFE